MVHNKDVTRLLEKITESAQDIDIPEELHPDQMEIKSIIMRSFAGSFQNSIRTCRYSAASPLSRDTSRSANSSDHSAGLFAYSRSFLLHLFDRIRKILFLYLHATKTGGFGTLSMYNKKHVAFSIVPGGQLWKITLNRYVWRARLSLERTVFSFICSSFAISLLEPGGSGTESWKDVHAGAKL